FTFYSDDNPDLMGGLMYDDLCFYEFAEGISETRFKPMRTTIYPNPSGSFFTIGFDNPKSEYFELAIYNELSERVITHENVTGKSVSFDASNLNEGIYYYKLTNNNLKERGWGKFVVIE
ncbi:MAG: T9SS type A sorting domain-containing protein, partial [Bacteroidetes bacterium]|nr:T9SS type A sorting domain-containing protein [Bacteroidota bacterium]